MASGAWPAMEQRWCRAVQTEKAGGVQQQFGEGDNLDKDMGPGARCKGQGPWAMGQGHGRGHLALPRCTMCGKHGPVVVGRDGNPTLGQALAG